MSAALAEKKKPAKAKDKPQKTLRIEGAKGLFRCQNDLREVARLDVAFGQYTGLTMACRGATTKQRVGALCEMLRACDAFGIEPQFYGPEKDQAAFAFLFTAFHSGLKASEVEQKVLAEGFDLDMSHEIVRIAQEVIYG